MKKMNKKAFTLAEVLITLSILGIVAALSIPNIISNYNERVTITKVKKMYSILNSAYSMALAENVIKENTIFGFTEDGATKIAEIFKQYLAVSKDCGTTMVGKTECGMVNSNYKTINGDNWGTNYLTNNRFYVLELKDGSLIWFRGYDDNDNNTNIAFTYDINGGKNPNQFGKDTFHFYANQTNPGLIPVGDNEETFNNRCKLDNADGLGCTAWVVYKGNMVYLKCRDKLTWSMHKCP